MLKTLSILLAPALFASCMSRSEAQSPSDIRVTNGKEESGFPYVVRLVMDGRGTCTGSFVSDSLLVTAAHCVDKAASVAWGKVSVTREHMFIHPNWPTEKSDCKQRAEPKYDVALVRFPAGTYAGKEVARLSSRQPNVGDPFQIVGYGNNQIVPFERFCKLSGPSNGKCLVLSGTREPGSAKYNYETVFEFPPQNPAEQVGCPVPCRSDNLKVALEKSQLTTFDTFVVEACGGNFRDRSYKETGSGTKRSGMNVVRQVQDGMIRFMGGTGDRNDGIDSASGAGDSGGPLFIFENDMPRIAAVTHGGSLGVREEEDDFVKNSIYVDLHAPHNMDWIRRTVTTQQLNFPGLR